MIHRRKDGTINAEEFGVKIQAIPASRGFVVVVNSGLGGWRFPSRTSEGLWRGVFDRSKDVADLVDTMTRGVTRIEVRGANRRSRKMAAAVAYLLKRGHRKQAACIDPGRCWVGSRAKAAWDSAVRREPWQ